LAPGLARKTKKNGLVKESQRLRNPGRTSFDRKIGIELRFLKVKSYISVSAKEVH
jgi:hypothetical protein